MPRVSKPLNQAVSSWCIDGQESALIARNCELAIFSTQVSRLDLYGSATWSISSTSSVARRSASGGNISDTPCLCALHPVSPATEQRSSTRQASIESKNCRGDCDYQADEEESSVVCFQDTCSCWLVAVIWEYTNDPTAYGDEVSQTGKFTRSTSIVRIVHPNKTKPIGKPSPPNSFFSAPG